MKQKFDNQAAPELFFIAGSSLDSKGKRVLVREGVIENWLWPEDGFSEMDKLIGITTEQRGQIETFFAFTAFCLIPRFSKRPSGRYK